MLLIIVFIAELGFSGPMMAGVPLLANQTGWGVRASAWFSVSFRARRGGCAPGLLLQQPPPPHRSRCALGFRR
jgi:hypothetical protein